MLRVHIDKASRDLLERGSEVRTVPPIVPVLRRLTCSMLPARWEPRPGDLDWCR